MRQDRNDGLKGGLAMFIKIGLKYDALINDTVNESQTVGISTDSGNIVVANVYVAPNVYIDKSSMNTLFKGNKTLVVGDLNAKSQLWGSPEQNNRGNVLEKLIEENDFVVVKTGQPTYQIHHGGLSYLDVTFASVKHKM